VGYDAAKRIKGRKRHLLVDTLGLVLGVAVTPASTPERAGAQAVLDRPLQWFTRLRRLWVDGGYTVLLRSACVTPKSGAPVGFRQVRVAERWILASHPLPAAAMAC
jgi:transposase